MTCLREWNQGKNFFIKSRKIVVTSLMTDSKNDAENEIKFALQK